MPFPSPRDLPDPRIEPRSPTQLADSLPTELPEKPLMQTIGFSKSSLSASVIGVTVAVHGAPLYTCEGRTLPHDP